jgi:hypothetical protein
MDVSAHGGFVRRHSQSAFEALAQRGIPAKFDPPADMAQRAALHALGELFRLVVVLRSTPRLVSGLTPRWSALRSAPGAFTILAPVPTPRLLAEVARGTARASLGLDAARRFSAGCVSANAPFWCAGFSFEGAGARRTSRDAQSVVGLGLLRPRRGFRHRRCISFGG